MRRYLASTGVSVKQFSPNASEASTVADTGSPGYRLIASAVNAVAPEALVVPGLVVAGTDSRHYGRISDAAFRFVPVRMASADVKRIHGTDERISVRNYGELIAFYERLMRASTGAAAMAPATE